MKISGKNIPLAFLVAVIMLSAALNSASAANPKAKPQTKKNLRVLYWNIQNGMWAGQGDNYDKFVEWIKKHDPDVCIFCEASTIYETGTDHEIPLEERYLPAHWPELAARYNHSYTQLGPRRKSSSAKYGIWNYPQVITSKYPIDSLYSSVGEQPDSVVVGGTLWAQIRPEGAGKPINIVTLHLKTGKHGYGVPNEKKAESAAKYEGELHRIKELTYIMNHTVRTSPNPDEEYWIMAGDYNSYCRKDNFKYKWNDSSLGFMTHDFMASKSPYFDVVVESFPGMFMPSHGINERIDYFYVTKALLNACSEVQAEVDMYTKRVHSGVNKFYIPSDHYPIIVDFKLSKIK